MDDPDLVWPAWKFGMKRDDLFTTLHDQYNTFSYTLQDPEAFHHDVYEVSRMADTTEEFHRCMADRQRQRITELNESLESLAVEIIANPKLMGTDQWQHALQLFRTRSFDSVVRYFASYLPDEYLDRHGLGSVTSSTSSYSETDSISTKASSASNASSPFLDDFFPHGSAMTDEPCIIDYTHLPLSPDSEGACARSSDSSSIYAPTLSTGPPSRSMSFSGSESGRLSARFSRRRSMHMGGGDGEGGGDDDDDDDDECGMTVASVCDSAETRSSYDFTDNDVNAQEPSVRVVDCEEEDDVDEHDDEEFPPTQYPEDEFCTFDTYKAFNTYDTLDSDTSTPRQVHDSTCYVEHKTAFSQVLPSPGRRVRRSRSPSPSLRSCLVHRADKTHSHDKRRSPEEALSKIQKTLSDPFRKRPRRIRWLD